ncbi:MAG: dihydroorotate dehydrogenase electron transfer subunit [Anaerolineae bacterium]|nr:dihydroorotate dehydrogenase electron transfer subunit [Anaerolineae bacterium]
MSLPQTVRIRQVREDTHTIRTFMLDAEVSEAKPGQFVMIWLPGLDEKPMSIAHPAPLTVTVASVGPFTMKLHEKKAGDTIGWRGPYGHGFSLREDVPALLLGGGCGVGPMRFLATRAVERSIPTTVAIGAHTGSELACVGDFEMLGVDLILTTDDGSRGHQGYVTQAISLFARDHAEFAVYACGPEPMLVAIHKLCRERNISGQMSLERYMKCGLGICGQCSLDGYLVCQDGPVFDVEQLDGLHDFGRARRTATGRRLPLRNG